MEDGTICFGPDIVARVADYTSHGTNTQWIDLKVEKITSYVDIKYYRPSLPPTRT